MGASSALLGRQSPTSLVLGLVPALTLVALWRIRGDRRIGTERP